MKNTNPSEFRNPAEEVLNQLLALMQNVQQQSGSESLFYDNADLKCLFHLACCQKRKKVGAALR